MQGLPDHLVDWLLRQKADAQSEEELSSGEHQLPPKVAWFIPHPPLAVRQRVVVIFDVFSAVPKHDDVSDQVNTNVPDC